MGVFAHASMNVCSPCVFILFSTCVCAANTCVYVCFVWVCVSYFLRVFPYASGTFILPSAGACACVCVQTTQHKRTSASFFSTKLNYLTIKCLTKPNTSAPQLPFPTPAAGYHLCRQLVQSALILVPPFSVHPPTHPRTQAHRDRHARTHARTHTHIHMLRLLRNVLDPERSRTNVCVCVCVCVCVFKLSDLGSIRGIRSPD